LVADYTFNLGWANRLLVKLGFHEENILVDKPVANTADQTDDFHWAATSIGVGFSLDGISTFEGMFRWLNDNVYVFGVYARPYGILDNFDAVAGFTFGVDNNTNTNEIGIDARVELDISDTLSIAAYANITRYTTNNWGMWLSANGSLAFNDIITGRLTASYIDETQAADPGTKTVNGLVGVEFHAMRNCGIYTGVEVRYNLDTASTEAYIPCILRVQL
jgi:hypothetical protein